MNRNHLLLGAGVVLGTVGLLAAAEKIIRTTDPSAAELVNAALRSELEGSSELRGQLLAEALKQDPDYAPARWQSGYVKFDGQWIKVDEVPHHARANEQLAEYRKLRDSLVDTADNHRELARWCHKRKLLDEERVHWAKVLEFERSDAEAITALGLQLYGGKLLTKAQIDAEKKKAVETQRAFHEWQPKIMKWRKAIEQGNAKQLDEALRKLRELDDPAAIPALEAVFSVTSNAKKSAELNSALIEALSRFPHQQATDVLLRRAVLSDSPEVCAAATDQLKKRPMHTYVPKLIAAIPGKLKTRFNLFVLPSGMVLHEHEFYLEGHESDLSVTVESVVSPSDSFMAMLITPSAVNRELLSALRAERNAAMQRAKRDAISDKVRWVLERTTGFANADDPALWQAQYDNYYTGNYSPTVKPIYHQEYVSGLTFFSAPTNTNTGTVRMNHSCFPAGTRVWTIMGQTPIEAVKPGDLVLSQVLETGEIGYCPVQSTTLRQRTGMIKISLGPESIVATQAHPFWVIGEGWKSAKQLRLGDRLYTVCGSAEIDNLEEVRPAEAYNLVVSERHNYFVGASRVLVHDNSPLSEVAVSLPGFISDVETNQTAGN